MTATLVVNADLGNYSSALASADTAPLRKPRLQLRDSRETSRTTMVFLLRPVPPMA